MSRDPIPTWCFAVVVVRRGDQFLIVQERKHDQKWYLPAGRVEPGESFEETAHRETLEETSIPIRIVGVLRVEHAPRKNSARIRVIFIAEPSDQTAPKSIPDQESLQAKWIRVDQLSEIPLRGAEVEEMLTYVANGGPVYPMTILQREGMPFRCEP